MKTTLHRLADCSLEQLRYAKARGMTENTFDNSAEAFIETIAQEVLRTEETSDRETVIAELEEVFDCRLSENMTRAKMLFYLGAPAVDGMERISAGKSAENVYDQDNAQSIAFSVAELVAA